VASAALFKTSLDLLHYSGASAALSPVFGGIGAIFMLHHVRPGGGLDTGFAPNRGLEVTPEFLDAVICRVKARGFDLVNLDEARRRMVECGAPFAAFTLDDGYRDNLVHAQPVFARHGCPFTIYVAPAITDGTCELWWKGLEEVIARADRIEAEIGSQKFNLTAGNDSQKWDAWNELYWPVRRLEQHEQRAWIRSFCARYGVDLESQCRALAMNWTEIRQIAADPLCTIGAHTVHHFNVKALPESEALAEMTRSADRIAAETGLRPKHFAYPYGDETSAGPRDFRLAREAGFETAVTTRKGLLYAAHRDHLTALPRFSLAGDYQKMRYVDTLLTGVPFALFNGLRTLNVA
jgi:peptidoglycan/xylan/chitin deacetylase (PgdA/CDA1 family)